MRVRIQSRSSALADYSNALLEVKYINQTYFNLRAQPFGAKPWCRVARSLLAKYKYKSNLSLCGRAL
jgi:hypothetical protein